MNDPVVIDIRETGSSEAAMNFAALSKSSGDVDANLKKLDLSMKAANQNTADLKKHGAAAAQAMTSLSMGVSQLAPELAGATQTISVANGAFQGMLTLVGGGPGILLGGLVSASALLARA
jgi:hypothetical protein